MQLSIIVAMDRNRVIGRGGALPWHISSDLKNFKKITMGKPILMGRKTHDSIGKPLPGRENIILTNNKKYSAEGCTVKNTLDEVYSYCEEQLELVVMGGAILYSQTLDKADKLYITEVNASVNGDTFFPELVEDWREIKREDCFKDDNHKYNYSFIVLEKK